MKLMLAWYYVPDMERAKQFYGTTLGLSKTFEMPGWAEFAHAPGSAAVGLNAMSPEPPGEGGATVVLDVSDVAAERERLSKSGVEFVGETLEIPGVVKIATFRDPFGNRLQLAQSLL